MTTRDYYKENEPDVFQRLVQVETELNKYAANLIAGNSPNSFNVAVAIHSILATPPTPEAEEEAK